MFAIIATTGKKRYYLFSFGGLSRSIEKKHISNSSFVSRNLQKHVYFHQARTRLTGFKIVHNYVFSRLFRVKVLHRVKNNYFQRRDGTLYTTLVSNSFPTSVVISKAKVRNSRRLDLEATSFQQKEGENAQALFENNAHIRLSVDIQPTEMTLCKCKC